jgi:2-alkyl-3-oxoalkanoate reductase
MDLLTGATGFLGGHLARRLAADGRKLRALIRPGTDLKRIPEEIAEIVWGEFDDPEALEAATEGIDTVFHTAARVSGGGSRAAFEADNVRASEALLDAAVRAGVRRFVHVSSAGIFGAGAGKTPITEETPLDPAIEKRGFYAWSKAESDRRVRALGAERGLEVVVVRPGILYGPDLQPFIARLHLPVPRGKGRRIIVGSRSTLIPLTHVDNACEAIALAAARGKPGASYNVIDGDVSQGQYLDLLNAAQVSNVRPIYLPALFMVPVAAACEVAGRLLRRSLPLSRYRLRRATESLRYDTSAARRDLGWQPRIDLAAGVQSLRPAGATAGTGAEPAAAAS